MAHSKQEIFIDQQKYIKNLLNEIGKLLWRPTSTPVDPNHIFGSTGEDVDVNKEIYQRCAGRLIYLSYTKPDITNVLSIISQLM